MSLVLVYLEQKEGDVGDVEIPTDQGSKVMGGVMLEDCTVVLQTCIANERMVCFICTFVVSPDDTKINDMKDIK